MPKIRFTNIKYKVRKDCAFPIGLTFYYEHVGTLGFITLYKSGKFYTDLFDSGINIKYARKILKIANRYRRRLVIKQKFLILKNKLRRSNKYETNDNSLRR